jgi:hypothetical protein
MRAAGRFLFAVLCMVLIGGTIGALSGSSADLPGREAAFHAPHHPSPVIEIATINAAAPSADKWIAAPVTVLAPRVSPGTRVTDRRTIRALAPTLETALDQRPPPPTSLD